MKTNLERSGLTNSGNSSDVNVFSMERIAIQPYILEECSWADAALSFDGANASIKPRVFRAMEKVRRGSVAFQVFMMNSTRKSPIAGKDKLLDGTQLLHLKELHIYMSEVILHADTLKAVRRSVS